MTKEEQDFLDDLDAIAASRSYRTVPRDACRKAAAKIRELMERLEEAEEGLDVILSGQSM